jgi:hypothetical protein
MVVHFLAKSGITQEMKIQDQCSQVRVPVRRFGRFYVLTAAWRASFLSRCVFRPFVDRYACFEWKRSAGPFWASIGLGRCKNGSGNEITRN